LQLRKDNLKIPKEFFEPDMVTISSRALIPKLSFPLDKQAQIAL